MLWQIFGFAFLALLSADVLGCLFNGGRITAPAPGGGKKLSLGAFTHHHTALNLFRAVVIGMLVGLAHWWPQYAESPLLGCLFHVAMMILLIWSTFWFLRHAKTWGQMLWFAMLATAIILAAQHAARVMALWWNSRILSWIFCVIPWILFIVAVGFAAFVLAMRFYRCRRSALGWKIVAIVIAVWAILAIILVIAFGNQITGLPSKTARAAAASNTSQATESVKPTVPSKEEQTKTAVNKLTVPLVTPEELEKLTIDKYSKISEELLTSSLTPHDKPRTDKAGFSDALTYGFKSKAEEAMFAELQEEILRNPVYGVTVANALRDKKIGNKTLGDINPWMNTMCNKNAQGGVSAWCEYRDSDKKTLYVTEEYRRYAASLCSLLERLISQGVQARQTVENWCLNNASENNKRAGVLADYQYKKDALILAYVTKSQAGTNEGLLIVGFNVHDKRPEFYGKEDTPELPNAPSTPSGTPSNPSNPSNPDTPDKPDIPDNPKPTTPETPTYNKDKSLSDNSGTNDDPGPGPDTNNGVGANGSSADVNGGNGTPSNYAEEEQRHENDNAGQKVGGDSSTPSYSGGGTVDNNGSDADRPSSQGGYEPELPGGSGSGKQHWDGAGI